jgi:hypothetical protein
MYKMTLILGLAGIGSLLASTVQAQPAGPETDLPALQATEPEIEQSELQEQFRNIIEKKLKIFESQAQPDCGSTDLKDAVVYAVEAQEEWYERDVDARLIALSGSTILDIADSARAKGCNEIARDLYEYVLATYEEPEYEYLRQRAGVGLGRM